MRNVRMTICVVVVVWAMLFGGLAKVSAVTLFDDGGIHNIDWLIEGDVEVWDSFYGVATIVNLLSGGSIGSNLTAYHNSQVTISGGSIGTYLYARGNSQVTISGGSIGYSLRADANSQITISGGSIANLNAHANSQVNISGGSIGGYLNAYYNSQVTISGGSIGYSLRAAYSSQVTISGGSIGDDIYAGTGSTDNATVTFVGSNFAINGTSVGYGEYDTMGRDFVHATLTGTLTNGDLLNNELYIHGDSSIVLVPEPATLLLLGLGGLMLRRRKC